MTALTKPDQSALFLKVVQEKSLPHPTSRRFTEDSWLAALKGLSAPENRDLQIAAAAVHFGRQAHSLRETFDQKIFKNLSSNDAKIFSVAFANREFFILQGKTKVQAKTKMNKGVARLDGLGNMLVSGATSGNQASPDAIAATIVDTLPHCLERAQRLPKDISSAELIFDPDHSKLYAVLSIEHSLRDLWQQVLWGGAALTIQDDKLRYAPTNKALAELWVAWTRRLEGVASQGALLDTIINKRKRILGHDTKPYLDKTVVGIGTGAGGRSFRFGAQAAAAGNQSHHMSEMTILEESYLADFIDTPLPFFGKQALTCRDLHRIWCVLNDAAEVLRIKNKSKELMDVASARHFALLMRTSELERAVTECTGAAVEKASAAVKFLSLNASDTTAMFADGFWSRPILSIDDDESVLISASLAVGSPIRRIEYWLTRGDIADHLSNSRRGLNYEAHVRAELSKAITGNKLFSDSYCRPGGFSAGPDGEQIDLIFRLGDLIVVGEVKCLLSPVEPIEQFNYLRKLQDACDQAERKAAWLQGNLEAAAKALGITTKRAAASRMVPLVVTNQGFGSSLVSGNVRLIDFHFLQLYLADGKYVAGAAFRQHEGDAVLQHEVLYKTEKDAEANFLPSIENPKPLRKYLDATKWIENKFPMSDGRELVISNCVIGQNLNPIDDGDIKKLFSS